MAKRAQPLTAVPTGQPYGAHKAETDYIRQAPMQAVPPVQAGPQQVPFEQQVAALRAGPAPNVVPLTAPTQRPGEPLTAGMATGPGPGPEVLGINPRPNRYADVLSSLAQAPGADPAWGQLADAARRLGQ
jgi:hypothetical protein